MQGAAERERVGTAREASSWWPWHGSGSAAPNSTRKGRDVSHLKWGTAWGVVLAVIAAACTEKSEKKATPAPEPVAARPAPLAQAEVDAGAPASANAAAEAQTIFSTRCFVCHGPNGKGDGPGSAGLDPKPRNFTDPAWQASVTDEHIEKIITYGGAAVGKSPAMPPNPDLVSKTEVVAALRAHVRSLKGK